MAKKTGLDKPAKSSKNGSVHKQTAEAKWTVMVFMGADNVPGEEPLSEEATADIREMEQVGSNHQLNIFVQRHGRKSVTRHHIGRGGPIVVAKEEEDATNGKSLVAFMKWALRAAGHRRQDHSMLVLWGHAYRFGIARAETASGIDALDFVELSAVLRTFQNEYRAQNLDQYQADMPKLDIVAFDACDIATVEMACELQPYANYLLASQIAIPLPGWPYDSILRRLKDPVDPPIAPVDLGTFIVRQYCTHYFERNKDKDTQQAVSLTLLDLNKAGEVFDAAEMLARKLAIAVEDPEEQELVSTLFQQSQTFAAKPFVDVADLCLNLSRYTNDEDVEGAAQRLGDLLALPVSPAPPQSNGANSAKARGNSQTPRSFVVEHGRNSNSTARLHGVSLYAPHVGDFDDDLEATSKLYERFSFAKKSVWSDLVFGLAEQD